MNEHDNTVRLLSDQKPLVSSIWCYFGFHNYERWNDAYRPNESRVVFMQNRKCCHCNIIQTREIKIPDMLK